MLQLKLKQLQFEAETWKRSLGFMKDENIHLKNRLSEILRDKFDKIMLEEVEDFQSSFIEEDEMINLFQNEISELDKMLTKETTEEGSQIKKADKKLRRLRINILKAEEEFSKLKVNFNNYLFENLSVNTGENELLK